MRSLPEEELHVFLRRRRHRGRELEPPPVGQWIMETLDLGCRLVPTEMGFLYMNDPTCDRADSLLSIVACFGTHAENFLGTDIGQGQGFAGHVFGAETTQKWSGRQLRAARQNDVLERVPTRSVIAAPIWLEATVSGVLELRNRKGRFGFTHRDQTLVDLLARYISRAVLNAVDILKQNDLALHDDLTGLRNSRGMQHYLESCIQQSRRGDDLSVIFVDVDHLKSINDELGHQAGSEAIRRTADALEAAVHKQGMAFRFGGDEFVVILPGISIQEARKIALEIKTCVFAQTGGPLPQGSALPSITTSLGVGSLLSSLIPQNTLPPGLDQPKRSRSARLLGAADRALYRAKENGRNCIAVASTHDDPALVTHPSGEWTAVFGE